MEIIQALMDQLGITEEQATGGAGAVLNLVKDKVSGGNFSELSAAIPGMDDLLAAAPKSDGLAGTMGGLTSMLGGGANKVGGLAALAGSFEKLGMDMNMVSKFVPAIVSFVQSKGGDSLKNMLNEVLN